MSNRILISKLFQNKIRILVLLMMERVFQNLDLSEENGRINKRKIRKTHQNILIKHLREALLRSSWSTVKML